jgi:hypothetical protein
VGGVSFTARRDEAMMTEVLTEKSVACFESAILFPVCVGLRQACNVELVRCDIFCCQIYFAVVIFGIEAMRVLEEEPHAVRRLIEG